MSDVAVQIYETEDEDAEKDDREEQDEEGDGDEEAVDANYTKTCGSTQDARRTTDMGVRLKQNSKEKYNFESGCCRKPT